MATAWVRSLSCRSSYAVTDAAIAPTPTKKPPPPQPFSCATAAAADVMDAVAYAQQQARRKKMGRERERERRREAAQREPRPRPKKKPKPMATKAKAKDAADAAATGALFMPSPAPGQPVSSAFLTMAELPEGHSSRRVVELIFASGWAAGGACAGSSPPEPPTVEALFRVHSSSRAVARFEEARAAARAHGAAARCGADGNEMMRFQCRASPADSDAPGGVFGAGVATCRLGASVSAVRTFACSGAAHASSAATGGGGATAGRRAMLVCRVIAGRVCPANHPSPRHAHGHGSAGTAYDSVDMGNGELVVLDSRAVLPCFLIIYKV